jgi:ParB family chromosome partitioning protein
MSKATEARVLIAVADLVPRPGNRERGGLDKEKLADLSESLKKRQLNDLLVRTAGDGKYEIMAGNRRLAAAKLAGLDVLACRVLDVQDDLEASVVAAVDNLQREGLHPLDESDGIKGLVALATERCAEDPVAEAAAKLGMTEYYVRQRLSLQNLVPAARAKLLSGAAPLANCLMLARYPKEAQLELMRERAWALTDRDAEDLHSMLESDRRELGGAYFDRADLTLVPKAGACAVCPKRTGHEPMLFPEVKKGDRCLDGKCWNAKLAAHVAKTKAELAKEPGHLLLSEHFGTHEAGVLPSDTWEQVKKSEQGALPALVVEGPSTGAVVYARRVAHSSVPAVRGESPAAVEKRRAALADQKIKAEARKAGQQKLLAETLAVLAPRFEGLFNREQTAVLQVLAHHAIDRTTWDLLPVVGKALGWEPRKRQYGGLDWAAAGKKYAQGADGVQLVLLMVRLATAGALVGTQGQDSGAALTAMATAAGLDPERVRFAAAAVTLREGRKAEKLRAQRRAARAAKAADKPPAGKKPAKRKAVAK